MRCALLIALLGAVACGTNNPPRLVALRNQEVAVGATLEILVTAVDGDGDPLSFSIEDKPERATFETTPLGARFLWTPIASDVPPGAASRTYEVSFLVHDGRGGSDGETVLITVSRGAPGEGAPVFITPGDYVLDLATQDRLDVTVAVQDDDSAEVSFELLEGPEGAALEPLGPKSAELLWTPTETQVADRTLWFLRVAASDPEHDPVEQTITVLLRRKPGDECPGTPPVVSHTALGDQSGPGPYRVLATVTDAESAIRSATLFWTTRASPTASDFQSVTMNRDPGGADLFAANIPDLGLAAGGSATVTYFLCASDDDDAAGDRCDRATCSPEGQQRYVFVATANGGGCTEDAQEPNDTPAAARVLTPGTPLRALRFCGGDDDWFQVTLAAGETLDASLSFTHANGDLDLDVYGPDGTTRLARADTSAPGVNEEVLSVRASAAGPHYLRVFGLAATANSYDLAATVRPAGSCADDAREPNDASGVAPTLAAGTYDNLTVCAGNADWYRIPLRAGDNLAASIAFTHANGDLDLEVYRPDRATLLGKSDGVEDGESLSFRVVPETGFYYVKVYGYRNAQNGYRLTLAGGQCQDDALEDNDAQAAARVLSAGTQRTLALCAGDEDWYKITVAQNQTLRVAARFKHAAGDIDLRVLRPDGQPLASSVSLDDDEVIAIARAPVAGAYLVHVFSPARAQNAYDLELAVTGP